MRTWHLSTLALTTAAFFLATPDEGKAAEYGFSTYGLGGAAFGAGVTPPPGTYVTTVTGFYSGEIGGQLNFGNVVINSGGKVEGFTSGLNVLYVPEHKLFGGSVGLAVTVPVGRIAADATIGITPLPVISYRGRSMAGVLAISSPERRSDGSSATSPTSSMCRQ